MKNTISTKAIKELSKNNYFIPDYQRGYRWELRQVKDLLEDIDRFNPESILNSDEKTWYCLQPIVLKKGKDHFEVIDGQQRLTTIFLIGHYINEMWRGKAKDPEIRISYQTREKSTVFLENIQVNSNDDVDISEENIDYYHISKAYQTIHKWVKEREIEQDNFIAKYLNHTKVIWYECSEGDAIKIFTRLNSGKIPLTNSELVKALFLNEINFKDADYEKLKLKQFEIAGEWDRIEYALNSDEFWFFLNEKENKVANKIEFILDLLANKKVSDDEYFTFRFFNSKFQTNNSQSSKEDIIATHWLEIKRTFQIFEEWHDDREYYHKIGFLIACGENISSLLQEFQNCSKDKFREKVNARISNKIPDSIDELEYGNSKLKNVLLLYNVQTMLNQNEENSKFPFNRFKKEDWDIEHIHAVQEGKPSNEKHQKDWLEQADTFIEDIELSNKIKLYSRETFDELFTAILKKFAENGQHEDINDISNLALLDASTNRGYGNAVFPVKRKIIINKDRNGTFIPTCTKNVFMKYFSTDSTPQMTFWSVEDRENYLNDIKKVLKPYKKQV